MNRKIETEVETTLTNAQSACKWCGHAKRLDRGDVFAYAFGEYHIGCARSFIECEIRKGRTYIKRSQINEFDPKCVIDYGWLKERIGGRFEKVRMALREDYQKWPVVVFHYENVMAVKSRCVVWTEK